MPDSVIKINPENEGVDTLGKTRKTKPEKAISVPVHSATCSRPPLKSVARIIVICTVPKRMSAPVPVSKVI